MTGGYTGIDNIQGSSTELLMESASAWVFTAELPYTLIALSGATIDNRILMTGRKKIFLVSHNFFKDSFQAVDYNVA